MTVDEYIAEELKRIDCIKMLRLKGSEIEADREEVELKKWQYKLFGFSHGDKQTIGTQLKLLKIAMKGEL